MSDRMQGMPFHQLLDWVTTEYQTSRSIFGIPEEKFFRPQAENGGEIFGQKLAMPIGPAAGPHTQLAQNIAAAYLCGSRFFELKTVQVMDQLVIDKPCILAKDEGYNTEWSTELSIADAYGEYVKAWFLLHFLADFLQLSRERDFVFNMSVGYDLAGIKTAKIDGFIEGLKDAADSEIFQECRAVLSARCSAGQSADPAWIQTISPQICQSITLSTMHGCPPAEIEAICRYLLSEKKLHLYVKMNPTLLGFEWVRQTLQQIGYSDIQLKESSFSHDLGYADGCGMLHRLQDYAGEQGKHFGVKLSNTLPVAISHGELPGEEMYMSGRALYPLTINLALRLAREFQGHLAISFSGGGDYFNLLKIFKTGIRPLTMATTLLKPGGYLRLRQIAGELSGHLAEGPAAGIDISRLEELAADSLQNDHYRKQSPWSSRKLPNKLPLLDCFIAPCQQGCPIGQDIPEYLRLVGLADYAAAYRLIARKNPLPAITGEICDHPCTGKCTRLDYDTPVCIREMKKIAAESGSQAYRLQGAALQPANHIRVAIIGSGPAGLSAGYFLAGQGFAVTIFDQHDQAGGTVARIIPDFRISGQAISHDLALIESRGVQFHLAAAANFDLAKLKAAGFQYICLAIGAGHSQSIAIPGGEKIIPAIPFLAEYKKQPAAIHLGQSVAVIGGGNSAMDAARAAKRIPGVEKVTVVYRRTRELMPAHGEEIAAALQEGIVLCELLQPLAYAAGRLVCQKMILGTPGTDGRRQPEAVPGQEVTIPAETVIAAVGETVESDLLRQNGLIFDAHGFVAVDPATLETSISNVFIAGDALSGPATVVKAIAGGRKMAESVCAKAGQSWVDPAALAAGDRRSEKSAVQNRKGQLQAVLPGEKEAERCLACGQLCNICVEVCPNRANIMVKTAGLHDSNQVIHLDALCNHCGNCATFCPYDGAPYRDKLTLYQNEADFSSDENAGFYWLSKEGDPCFQVRANHRQDQYVLAGQGGAVDGLDQGIYTVLTAVWQQHRYLFTSDDHVLPER